MVTFLPEAVLKLFCALALRSDIVLMRMAHAQGLCWKRSSNHKTALPQSQVLQLFRAKRGLYSDSDKKVWLHPYSSRSCKMLFLLAISSCFPSSTIRLPNTDFYLHKNTERLQASRFAGFYLSCSKVRVGFISSPIFPIASCCFFVLLIHVKHGFLFSENLIPPTLCQFW